MTIKMDNTIAKIGRRIKNSLMKKLDKVCNSL